MKAILLSSIILLAGCTPLNAILFVEAQPNIEPKIELGLSENPTIIISSFPKTQGTYWF